MAFFTPIGLDPPEADWFFTLFFEPFSGLDQLIHGFWAHPGPASHLVFDHSLTSHQWQYHGFGVSMG